MLRGLILENLNTAILLFDQQLTLRYINAAGESLLSISAKLALGDSVQNLLACSQEPITQRLDNALKTLNPFTEREVALIRTDGQIIHVNYTALPLTTFPWGNGVLMELQQVDRQLRIVREEQLLAQHQAVQTLLRGLAHEIKNPLGGLRGAAQLLERELSNPELHEYTRIIIAEADRLQNLLTRMLGPNQRPQRQWLNIHHLLERVRHLILAEFPDGPRVMRDYDPSIPEIQGDAELLMQALLNIARNGAQAAGSTGQLYICTRILRQFTLHTVRHRLVLQIKFEDDGPGIAPAMQEQIFFPMVSGREGGTGLGLPIAQELIHQHGGLIECESQGGRTCFFVYMPLTHDD
jgi:two-component system nitrogen regulation sensor histidine kinase GlnL